MFRTYKYFILIINVIFFCSSLCPSSLADQKQKLIEFIWKDDLLPQQLPNSITRGCIDDFGYQSQTLVVKMEYEFNSISCVWYPSSQNSINQLMVYHAGHGQKFWKANSIPILLSQGYTVIGLSMPFDGLNSLPEIQTEKGIIKPAREKSHNELSYLESKTFSPISLFLTPVISSLNYLNGNNNFNQISMMGISGGGWTTDLVSAIDTRITKNYSIAGSLPLDLRSAVEFGDYEQYLPELYSIAGYRDLYLLSANREGREKVQIINYYDPCCFWGDRYKAYENELSEKASELGGKFSVFVDHSHKDHIISDVALKKIIETDKYFKKGVESSHNKSINEHSGVIMLIFPWFFIWLLKKKGGVNAS